MSEDHKDYFASVPVICRILRPGEELPPNRVYWTAHDMIMVPATGKEIAGLAERGGLKTQGPIPWEALYPLQEPSGEIVQRLTIEMPDTLSAPTPDEITDTVAEIKKTHPVSYRFQKNANPPGPGTPRMEPT
jgi:hypothetical protein